MRSAGWKVHREATLHYKTKPFLSILLTLTLLAGLVTVALAAAGDTVRVSVDRNGVQGNSHSYTPDITPNGRFVAFTSLATNLVTGDTNNNYDVFVYDCEMEQISRVSVDSNGNQGNSYSLGAALSADGRFVVFSSYANNLVAGDTNNSYDTFVHDRVTGQTTRISVDSNGIQGNDYSSGPVSVSSDGRYIPFTSSASNLVAGDTNGVRDVFVYDRQTGITERVSVDSSGIQGNGFSRSPSISSDGRFVTFISYADNLVAGDTNGVVDAFLHDRVTGQTTLVSINSNGVQGDADTDWSMISSNSRYIVIESFSRNLVAGDINGLTDIFVHDRLSGQTTLVSVDSNGIQGNGYSFGPLISPEGRYVTFHSEANNLVTGDTNGEWDVFMHDRVTEETIRISVDSNGLQGNGDSSSFASISFNGNYVAFSSEASNLVMEDTNGASDIFVHEPYWSQAVEDDPNTLPTTGFPKGEVTKLPPQSSEKLYTNTELLLEIPTLNQKMAIVGVPQTGDSWDVTWLGNNTGWLNGSAFPTWAGNTVLTGHVWDAYNRPGPFAQLRTLKYGDQVKLHAFGQVYTYEVRESKLITSRNVKAVLQHEELDWVTLLSCEYYNPFTESYLFRRMVRAVLVSVK